jgi:hypothetical protein
MKIQNLDQQLDIFLNWVDETINIKLPNKAHFTFKGYSKEDTFITTEISDKTYLKFRGYSKEEVQKIVKKRFEYRHKDENVINILRIEPKIIPNLSREKDCYLIGKIFYKIGESNEVEKEWKMVLYLFSKDEIWAGMEIKDPYGYLDQILDDIEKGIIKGKDWQEIEEDIGVEEEILKKLSSKLEGYSRIKIRNLIREKLEERYYSNSDIIAELLEIEVNVMRNHKGGAFVMGILGWSINTQNEIGIDNTVMKFYMSSKEDIEVGWKE